MRADRLLSALLLLQAHGRLTGRDLARRLEVSERTVHRDMEALGAAGVPIFAERGARGGWRLSDGWQTTVPGLEANELRALLLAQPARMLGDLRLGGAAERALGKLMASLPTALREQAASMRQRLFVDVEGWYATSENLAVLPVVQDAVWRDRKLHMRYWRTTRGTREQVERLVDPLGLVAKGSAWYLIARTPDGFRTYRVSRIEEATVLEEPCARPPDFDLAAYWKTSSADYRESWPHFDALLRVEPRAAGWMRIWRHYWKVDQVGDPDADGWLTLRVAFEWEEVAMFTVLGLGTRVDVLEPAALRERVRAEAAATAARIVPAETSEPGATGWPALAHGSVATCATKATPAEAARIAPAEALSTEAPAPADRGATRGTTDAATTAAAPIPPADARSTAEARSTEPPAPASHGGAAREATDAAATAAAKTRSTAEGRLTKPPAPAPHGGAAREATDAAATAAAKTRSTAEGQLTKPPAPAPHGGAAREATDAATTTTTADTPSAKTRSAARRTPLREPATRSRAVPATPTSSRQRDG